MIEPWMIFLAIAAFWVFVGLGWCALMDWREAPDEVLARVAAEMGAP